MGKSGTAWKNVENQWIQVMLRGAHAISLDSKGRFAIPTSYRAQLCDDTETCLICTVDIANPCLLLYPLV